MISGHIDAAEEALENRAKVVTDLDGFETEMTIDSVRGNWKSYYQNISDVLNNDGDLAVTPQSVRSVMAVLDAATRSLKDGTSIDVKV